MLGLFITLFVAFFGFSKDYRIIQYQWSAPIPLLRLIPDTIKINGDALSFLQKQKSGRTYQVFYTLKSEKKTAVANKSLAG